MIEAILNYLKNCPYIDDISIDNLGVKRGSFTLEKVESKPIITRYFSGDTLRQIVFLIRIRGIYSVTLPSTQNSILCEQITAWIENGKALPILENGVAQAVEVLDSGHLVKSGVNSCEYQIKCRLIYNMN